MLPRLDGVNPAFPCPAAVKIPASAPPDTALIAWRATERKPLETLKCAIIFFVDRIISSKVFHRLSKIKDGLCTLWFHGRAEKGVGR